MAEWCWRIPPVFMSYRTDLDSFKAYGSAYILNRTCWSHCPSSYIYIRNIGLIYLPNLNLMPFKPGKRFEATISLLFCLFQWSQVYWYKQHYTYPKKNPQVMASKHGQLSTQQRRTGPIRCRWLQLWITRKNDFCLAKVKIILFYYYSSHFGPFAR